MNKWTKEIKGNTIPRPGGMKNTMIDHLNLTIMRKFNVPMNRGSNILHGIQPR